MADVFDERRAAIGIGYHSRGEEYQVASKRDWCEGMGLRGEVGHTGQHGGPGQFMAFSSQNRSTVGFEVLQSQFDINKFLAKSAWKLAKQVSLSIDRGNR